MWWRPGTSRERNWMKMGPKGPIFSNFSHSILRSIPVDRICRRRRSRWDLLCLHLRTTSLSLRAPPADRICRRRKAAEGRRLPLPASPNLRRTGRIFDVDTPVSTSKIRPGTVAGSSHSSRQNRQKEGRKPALICLIWLHMGPYSSHHFLERFPLEIVQKMVGSSEGMSHFPWGRILAHLPATQSWAASGPGLCAGRGQNPIRVPKENGTCDRPGRMSFPLPEPKMTCASLSSRQITLESQQAGSRAPFGSTWGFWTEAENRKIFGP